MGHTFLCLLEFFSLSILFYCGHSQDLVLTVEPNLSTVFTGESVTLICDMRDGENVDWNYVILKDGQEIVSYITSYTMQHLMRFNSGVYQCFGRYNHLQNYHRESNKVSLRVSDAHVILEGPASVLYEGESVTLRCRHRTQRTNKNASFYKNGQRIETEHQSQNKAEITIRPESDGSFYTCGFDEDEQSEPTELKLESRRPKAKLKKDRIYVAVGGNVTLTCSVDSPSSGWKHFWYRGKKSSEPLTAQDAVFISNAKISVPQGGVYWCRGGRGEPLYYTEYSDSVVTHRAVVTLRPSWPEIYHGEQLTLTCEIENGGDIEWQYDWTLPINFRTTHSVQQQCKITYAEWSHNGDYRCLGRMKDGKSGTEWSDPFRLTISDKKPDLFLTVSPSWLSSGEPVTLRCHIKHPSAGWRFFWYQAVPRLPTSSYNFELLPGSGEGTEQGSYIVQGQTHTARYACRAGRGDPMHYTYYSSPTFVWWGDVDSAVSLTVSPDRGQHFYKEPVSLSCKGNSTMWKVSKLSKFGHLTSCSLWGTMIGSTCHINQGQSKAGVYWCESKTGQFSNAVNITEQNNDIILTSPIHPVAEGDSVTLGCKLNADDFASDVSFYKNSKLIQNDTRRELIIPAVSKSDEGFYKCKRSSGGRSWQSAESWMSVKTVSRPQSSPVPLVLIIGLVCGGFLIILMLLLLYYYTKTKDSCVVRSQSTNQGSTTDHMTNQDETQWKQYSSLNQGDDSLYESIKGPEDVENDESGDVTYSLIELKNLANKGKQNEPEESTVYSNTGSTAGKSSPAAENEIVYSEVRIRTSSW